MTTLRLVLGINKKKREVEFIFSFIIYFSSLLKSYVLTILIKHIHRFTNVTLSTVNKVFVTLQKTKHREE